MVEKTLKIHYNPEIISCEEIRKWYNEVGLQCPYSDEELRRPVKHNAYGVLRFSTIEIKGLKLKDISRLTNIVLRFDETHFRVSNNNGERYSELAEY